MKLISRALCVRGVISLKSRARKQKQAGLFFFSFFFFNYSWEFIYRLVTHVVLKEHWQSLELGLLIVNMQTLWKNKPQPPPLPTVHTHSQDTRGDECLGTLVPVIQQRIGTRLQRALQTASRSAWVEVEVVSEVFVRRPARIFLAGFVWNCSCSVWCPTQQTVIILSFMLLFWHFRSWTAGLGTVALVITYWAAGWRVTLHWWCHISAALKLNILPWIHYIKCRRYYFNDQAFIKSGDIYGTQPKSSHQVRSGHVYMKSRNR